MMFLKHLLIATVLGTSLNLLADVPATFNGIVKCNISYYETILQPSGLVIRDAKTITVEIQLAERRLYEGLKVIWETKQAFNVDLEPGYRMTLRPSMVLLTEHPEITRFYVTGQMIKKTGSSEKIIAVGTWVPKQEPLLYMASIEREQALLDVGKPLSDDVALSDKELIQAGLLPDKFVTGSSTNCYPSFNK